MPIYEELEEFKGTQNIIVSFDTTTLRCTLKDWLILKHIFITNNINYETVFE